MDADVVAKLLDPPDRRSIGRANEVVADVLADPSAFDGVFAAMADEEAVVRIRAADVVEKVSRIRPDLLTGHGADVLATAATAADSEVRWHCAQLLGRMPLTAEQRDCAVEVLRGYLADGSSIRKTCAMQSLYDLAIDDPELAADIVPLIERLTTTGTPAMRARGRQLLARLSR